MKNKKRAINYTNRDFNSIKNDLEKLAKVHYPDTYADFTENSFGSFILDAVSYVGDQLSFYLDYQVNETFFDTAIEYDNVKRMAENYGYKYSPRPSAFATAVFYVVVDASITGLGPDTQFIPVLKTGTEVRSDSDVNFVLTEDVDFNHPKNAVVAARFSESTGKPTAYAIRAYGSVRSTTRYRKRVGVGDFTRFRRVRVGPASIVDIVSVIDSEGHEYLEVENLSQDVVYVETTNPDVASDGVRSILKPRSVARRYTIVHDFSGTYLQFGSGTDEEITTTDYLDPSQAALKMSGRNYISDDRFDPARLLDTTGLGVCPSNTTLTVLYDVNSSDRINLSAGALNTVSSVFMDFPNRRTTSSRSTMASVRGSIEVSNPTPIVGNTSVPTKEELKIRTYSSFAAQSRAVTKNDYESYCYLMPAKFGSVKRAAVVTDPSFTDKIIDIYVVNEDSNGNLATTNETVKANLKTWLNRNSSLNDRIRIKDASICNLAFDYYVNIDPTKNKVSVLNRIHNRLKKEYVQKFEIGEPFYISNVYNLINKIEGVIDVKDVIMSLPTGASYSVPGIGLHEILSPDGTYLKPPKNVIFEIKNINSVVRGVAQ